MENVKLPSNWNEWKIVELVGKGSFGSVYKAERVLGDEKFYSAIKIIQIPANDDEVELLQKTGNSKEEIYYSYKDVVDSCVSEIKTMDKLKGCSHIVSIQDYYVEEDLEKIQWTLYIRMEFLQCFTDYRATHEMSEEKVIKLGVDICEALEYCEKVKIIHRDIKPDNIFISSLGDIKLGDFGVARQLEKTRAAYSIKGTQNYMAPEVLRGKEYGKETDIYSLGIVLYELMNNRRAPFLDTEKKMLRSKEIEKAFSCRMSGTDLPKPLKASDAFSAVILKACAYEVENRYQTASEMKRDLQELLQPEKTSSETISNKTGSGHIKEADSLMNVELPSNWSDWKIVQYVGSGSYGSVYKAERVLGDKRFYSAIKIIQIPETDREFETMRRRHKSEASLRIYYKDLVKSCVDEIQTMDILKGCSHIVSIEDYYVVEDLEKVQWTLYIRMEFLQCFTDYNLTHKMSEREVIKVGLDICEALETCEKVKVIHRDIKPDNIFVSPLGYVKLGDFGVARQLEETRGAYSIKGTKNYMAPEIFRGQAYGKETDIYSLGLVLYELMNKGRVPFIDVTKEQIRSRDREEAFGRRVGGEDLPKPVEASDAFSVVILKACAYKPEDRYQTASDLKRDLQEVMQLELNKSEKTGSRNLRNRRKSDRKLKKKSKKKSLKKLVLFLLTVMILAGLGVGGKIVWKQLEPKLKDLPVKLEAKSEKSEEDSVKEAEEVKEKPTEKAKKAEEDSAKKVEEVKEKPTEEAKKVEEELVKETEKVEEPPKEVAKAGMTMQKADYIVDIGNCADFIVYETKNGGNVEKFLFQKKLEEALVKENIEEDIVAKIMEEISIQDFVMDYDSQIPKGTPVTMTFHGAEKVKEKYNVTLVFRSITKDYE